MNRLLLSASALAALLLAACGGDAHDDARFSTADTLHFDRAVDVIQGGDAGELLLIGVFTSGENRTGCPTISTVGAVTTITTDCTNDDGDVLTGKVVVTNLPSDGPDSAYDPTKPSAVEAIGLAIDGDGQHQALDGKVTISVRDADYIGMLRAEVDATVDGIAAHTEVAYGCDDTDLCTFEDDSWFDVDGVGAAVLTGTFRFDEPRYGAITATGAETLVLDVVASTDGCRAITIDGQARTTCEPTARLTPAAGSADLAGPTAFARRFARAAEVQLLGEALLDHVRH